MAALPTHSTYKILLMRKLYFIEEKKSKILLMLKLYLMKKIYNIIEAQTVSYEKNL